MDLQETQTTLLWPLEAITPRDVQLEALEASKNKLGFAFFMRQRLGKTFVAFAEYTRLRQEGHVDWMVVICPNSIKQQWLEQIEIANPYIPIAIYNSQSKRHTYKYFKQNKRGGVFIINYEGVKAFNEEFFKDHMFNLGRTYIVADESTKIKEPTAKMTRACLELASLCAFKRVLTGKPTANSNADLWGQLKFIDATQLSSFSFRARFVQMGGYLGKQIVRNINENYLKSMIEPFCYIAPDKYIRGFKKEYEPMRRVNLTGDLLDQYQTMENDLVIALSSDVKITAPIALTQYLRLQQISSAIAGDVDGVQHNLVAPEYNPRIRVVREILNSEITHKVIIACRFRLSITNLRQELERDGHKVAYLVGGMSPHDIEEQKRLFNHGDHNIMVAQIQVLAYGHTLCGPDHNPCDSMIFYENDFSLLNRSQCESRPENMERAGLPISYYDLYASKMDRYLLQCLIRKEDAAMQLMGYVREHGIRPELTGKKIANQENF